MDQPPTSPADRACATSDTPEPASAPAEHPAGRGPIPVLSAVEEPSDPPWDSDEYRALVAAGSRAPNQRHFTLNSPEAWDLFRPEPSMLPHFPRHRHNPVERDR